MNIGTTVKRLIVVLLAALWFGITGFSPKTLEASNIVVKQDKNGNIYISNEPTTFRTKKRKKSYYRSKGKRYNATAGKYVPQKYLTKIRQLSRKYGVNEKLIIAVARAESGFNPRAVSKKGAVGIMQLMAPTAKQYGVTNRYDANQNMEAGVKHLKYLFNKYNGNLPLTLAAYNAGEKAVKKYRGIPPYKETKQYVRRVMRFMGRRYTGTTSYTAGTKIYQYRTKDGQIMITDSYPSNAVGEITIID